MKFKINIPAILAIITAGVIINLLSIGLIAYFLPFTKEYKLSGANEAINYVLLNPWEAISVLFKGSETAILSEVHNIYMNGTIQGIFWTIVAFFLLRSILKRRKKFDKEDAHEYGSHGSARWATNQEIKSRFHQTDQGMIVGAHKGKACIQPLDRSNNHMTVTYGGSGSGKTAGYIIPNIFHIAETLQESFVLTDPKGEIYNTTADYLRKQGYNIISINLLDLLYSHCYNPLDYIYSGLEAQALAKTIINNTSVGSKDRGDMWERAELSLLSAIIQYIKETRPKEEQHLTSVLEMGTSFGDNPKKIDEVFNELPKTSTARQLYRIFNLSEDRTRSGILIGFGVRLQLWAEPSIQKLTATSDFDLNDLGKKKTALYILTPDGESTFDMITALMIDQAFQELIKQANKNENEQLGVPVRMLLDELANIAPINDLQRRITAVRSRGVRVSLILQGVRQFENRYGKGVADEILDSADNQLLLAANHEATSRYFANKLGQTTIMISSQSETETRKGGSSGKNYNFTGKPLMNFTEIENKPDDDLILIQKGNKAPVYLKKYLYDKVNRWDYQKIHWSKEQPKAKEMPPVFRPENMQEPQELIQEPQQEKEEKQQIDLFN